MILFPFLVSELEEGYEYHFEVLAMSVSDFFSTSEKITLQVPPYKKVRAVSIGLVIGVLFIGFVLGGVFYYRRKLRKTYENNGKLSEK